MKFFLFFIFLGFVGTFNAQVVMSIEDSENKFNKDSLQEHYFYRIMSDEISECFDVPTDFFMNEWSKFTRELGVYLKDNNVLFGLRTKGTIEVYFNKEGKIDLFFISLRESQFPVDFYEKLYAGIKNFSKDYKFTIQAKQKFTNTGGVTFMH